MIYNEPYWWLHTFMWNQFVRRTNQDIVSYTEETERLIKKKFFLSFQWNGDCHWIPKANMIYLHFIVQLTAIQSEILSVVWCGTVVVYGTVFPPVVVLLYNEVHEITKKMTIMMHGNLTIKFFIWSIVVVCMYCCSVQIERRYAMQTRWADSVYSVCICLYLFFGIIHYCTLPGTIWLPFIITHHIVIQSTTKKHTYTLCKAKRWRISIPCIQNKCSNTVQTNHNTNTKHAEIIQIELAAGEFEH